MKKGLLHLVVVLIFILSGCNGRSVLNEWAVNVDAILSEDVSKDAFVNALARWVESDRLTSAEDTINAASAFTGMRAEFAIEGDDILVIKAGDIFPRCAQQYFFYYCFHIHNMRGGHRCKASVRSRELCEC